MNNHIDLVDTSSLLEGCHESTEMREIVEEAMQRARTAVPAVLVQAAKIIWAMIRGILNGESRFLRKIQVLPVPIQSFRPSARPSGLRGCILYLREAHLAQTVSWHGWLDLYLK